MEALTLTQRIDQDLKAALLSGDKNKATTLRGLKSAILYVEVAQNKRDEGLDEATIQTVLAKESKKRQESADLYVQGGNQERADAELAEKRIIDGYLPAQLSREELAGVVDRVVSNNFDLPMGQVIGLVKQQVGANADGSLIAQLVKERTGQ